MVSVVKKNIWACFGTVSKVFFVSKFNVFVSKFIFSTETLKIFLFGIIMLDSNNIQPIQVVSAIKKYLGLIWSRLQIIFCLQIQFFVSKVIYVNSYWDFSSFAYTFFISNTIFELSLELLP